MAKVNPIEIRSPKAYDIVDDPIQISGLAIAFEGVFQVRVRDRNGQEITEKSFLAAGGSFWRNFQITLPLGTVPTTPSGTLEVFEISAADGEGEINKVTVPIVFGRALIDPYHGFFQYEVKRGDTLSAIAREFYGNSALSNRIFEANRDQLVNPDRIFPGQFLRIPQ